MAREVVGLDLTFDTGAAVSAGAAVVVRLPDQTVVGMLRGVPVDGPGPLSACQRQGMAIIAGLIGRELDQQRTLERNGAQRRDALRHLFTGDGTSVVVQPIRRLAGNIIVGYEALSRFGGGQRGLIPADTVFEEARQLGLGVELELATARSALGLLPYIAAPSYLSVNLSPAALVDPRTADLFAGVKTRRVVLELTEHEQVEDYAALSRALRSLRKRGVRLAVDDAGAGFASLQHISLLNPDLIKLDRALIRAVQEDPSRRALVRAMVQFAHETSATLIAEGIEHEAERRQLIELGVELGQGFLLGHPAPPDQWLHRRSPLGTYGVARQRTRANA
ncbi:EAL domain-containing protein [Blastococcus saxobsidens]|uniref:Diguanylate phosphodiesterase n=1 Tax=Blastococcus saxobsidens (strain DD2) TaxID=1146883 RepID=H6RUA0_BLASD|nr:EAL domain-containing protein [Blastococcus saxobsidens]CCG05707.1 Diguanylate phosphodiesterase [Blastococcus saxobsidens DD2]